VNRRNFLQQGVGACLAFSVTAGATETASDPLIGKVESAMLSMQRASWEQGVAAQALLEMGRRDIVVLMAKEAVLRQGKDGRFALLGSGENVTDPGSNGEAVLYAAKVTGDAKFSEAAARMVDYFLHKAPRTEDGTICHLNTNTQVWDDSMYMAPPFLAVAGHADEAVRQVEGIRRALWNDKAKLYAHIWDAGRKQWVDGEFWGVGNGWVAAGLVRVLKALAVEMREERARLIGYLKEVIDGCLAHQREDGLFHNVVDKPATFVETNLAQMLAYSIYRGVKAGWLSQSYLAAADKMRAAARAKVDQYGLVQGVCGSPDFAHAGTATEGQAFFLLMEAARRDLPKA
jgi:rhamnogalacturonyl hydrolase YesR